MKNLLEYITLALGIGAAVSNCSGDGNIYLTSLALMSFEGWKNSLYW